jgi:hypothetical protein
MQRRTIPRIADTFILNAALHNKCFKCNAPNRYQAHRRLILAHDELSLRGTEARAVRSVPRPAPKGTGLRPCVKLANSILRRVEAAADPAAAARRSALARCGAKAYRTAAGPAIDVRDAGVEIDHQAPTVERIGASA